MQIKEVAKFLRTTFSQFTSGRLLLKFVVYLSLKSLWIKVSLNKSVLPHHMFNVEVFQNFDTGVQKNVFCFLSNFASNISQ